MLELRKQMMKSKVKAKKDNFGAAEAAVGEDGKKKKEPPLQLMHRLAKGEKPKVTPYLI